MRTRTNPWKPIRAIPDYATLLEWSRTCRTLSEQVIAVLRTKAAAAEAEALRFMDDVHRLRSDMIEVVDTLAVGQRPAVGVINRALSGLPGQPNLVGIAGQFVFDLDGSDLRQPLWPVLWSLTAVLASSDADRVGSCQADGCGWFFVDESPNHARLWCSDGCGNRERVRRSYAKRRAGAGP